MDMVSLAITMSVAKTVSRADIIAAKMIKDNAESGKAVADLLQSAQDNLETLTAAAGQPGALLDVTV